MVTIILVILAALFKSVADTLEHHFDTSVFKKLKPELWDPDRSTVKTWWITHYKIDPWHVANSMFIVSFILAAILNTLTWKWYLQLLVLGTVFNLVFEVFYSKILRRV